MIGWATGGVLLRHPRRPHRPGEDDGLTILLYSLFTGLSVFSVGVWDFSFYRFLTGLGVGGQFAVGVALVAESMPDRARPYALGWLQASSAVGNMMAATVGIILGSDADGRRTSTAPGGRCSWSARCRRCSASWCSRS